MSRNKKNWIVLEAGILLALLMVLLTGPEKALAEPFGFDFTYTAGDTTKFGAVWDTTQFASVLTNTGTEADSYSVSLTENPGTPPEWWVRMCAGGICWDSLVTSVNVYLEPGQHDDILLDVMPRTVDEGSFTITVESYGNPGIKLTKSKTFILTSYEPGPVTNQWGLIILILLLLASGLYLAYRRFAPVKET